MEYAELVNTYGRLADTRKSLEKRSILARRDHGTATTHAGGRPSTSPVTNFQRSRASNSGIHQDAIAHARNVTPRITGAYGSQAGIVSRRGPSVAPASVSGMVAKLDDRGLVDHEKYQGVRLTGEGREIAERVAWRVCLVTGFFDSVLDTAVDDQASFEIGFVLPLEGVVRLRELVNASCLDLCPESGRTHERCCV